MIRFALWTLFLALAVSLLSACGGSGGRDNTYTHSTDLDPELNEPPPDPLSHSFKSPADYTFEEWGLDESVMYWALKISVTWDDEPASVLYSFDDVQWTLLTDEQIAQIEEADSNLGFYNHFCPPDGYCPVFGVAVTVAGIEKQLTQSELLGFLQPLDTAPKLRLWLLAQGYSATSYEPDDGGYQVLAGPAGQDCFYDGIYTLFVDYNGVVTEVDFYSLAEEMVCHS